jgi:hypothetical protein
MILSYYNNDSSIVAYKARNATYSLNGHSYEGQLGTMAQFRVAISTGGDFTTFLKRCGISETKLSGGIYWTSTFGVNSAGEHKAWITLPSNTNKVDVSPTRRSDASNTLPIISFYNIHER